MPSMQPERLSEEDALLRKIFIENPSFLDRNGDMPLIIDKNGKILNRDEILSIYDSPNNSTKGVESNRND